MVIYGAHGYCTGLNISRTKTVKLSLFTQCWLSEWLPDYCLGRVRQRKERIGYRLTHAVAHVGALNTPLPLWPPGYGTPSPLCGLQA